MRTTPFFAAVTVGAWMSLSAAAGTIMELTIKDAGGAETDQTLITADESRLRMDSEMADGTPESSIIFDAAKDEMLILDHANAEATLIDKAAVDALSAQLRDAKAQMDQALASAPPAQRAMIKAMMANQMGAMMPPEVTVQQTSATGTTNGYAWIQYDVFTEGQKSGEFLVTEYANLGADSDALVVLQEMASFFAPLTESADLPFAARNPFAELSEMSGFPVISRHFENGQLDETTELTRLTVEDVDASIFENPGYAVERLSPGR